MTPDRPLRLVRVTHHYWPGTGGNETWNRTLDTWFSQVAGDDLTTVVLKQTDEPFDRARPADAPRRLDVDGMTHPVYELDFRHTFYQPDAVRQYARLIGPWMTPRVDAVQTQIMHYGAVPAWKTRRVLLEPEQIVACEYGRHVDCPRTGWLSCPRCAPPTRPAQWLRNELRLAMLARASVVAQNESVCDDVRRAGMGSKAFVLRHIVRPEDYDTYRDPALDGLWARVDMLKARCDAVVMQVNRLIAFKNPRRLLHLFAADARVGIVLGGDGPERAALEAEVAAVPGLSDRVVFAGRVPNRQVGVLLGMADAVVLTSELSNHNTALFEALKLAGGPVFATDVGDFPAELRPGVEFEPLDADDGAARARFHALRARPEEARAMVTAARAYIARYHGYDQLWAYRSRIAALGARP